MGSCLCKEKTQVDADSEDNSSEASSMRSANSGSVAKRARTMEPTTIEMLIIEMLRYISSSQESGDDTPAPLIKINVMADTEEGWCLVMCALITTVPMYDPLGPSTITIVFDDCPLPARDTVIGFTMSLDLRRARCLESYGTEEALRQERNLLILLGCIAEKFAGPNSVKVLTDDMLMYLVTFLTDLEDPYLVLHALITLEKFAATKENKIAIERCFRSHFLNPLLPLELKHGSSSYPWRQVGFCARWALDNIFLFPGRRFSFETVRMGEIHTILNARDVSEYLKISPDGLEARCDSHSFESVRATFQIDRDCWFYEAEIITAGVMQIGWATKNSSFQNHEGYGVGDDSFSIAYDGCRRLIWYKAEPRYCDSVPTWQVGDIVGCLIDVIRQEAIFSLNGQRLPVCTDIFANSSEGFYAAASFMAHQQCRFNFGSRKFMYPPSDRVYQTMNDFGILSSEQKKVIPRRILRQEIRLEDCVRERRCAVCLDEDGTYGLAPCEHGAFCLQCVKILDTCPICRRRITKFYILVL